MFIGTTGKTRSIRSDEPLTDYDSGPKLFAACSHLQCAFYCGDGRVLGFKKFGETFDGGDMFNPNSGDLHLYF